MHLNLSAKATQELSSILGGILADTYVLYTKTQNFHWNIVDPRFYALHKFLEEQYEELSEAIDEIAERIRMIGHRAPGSLKQFLALTSLKEANGEMNAEEMIQVLTEDHETLIQALREKIRKASDLADEGSADLLIQRIRAHEKFAWMLRSHL